MEISFVNTHKLSIREQGYTFTAMHVKCAHIVAVHHISMGFVRIPLFNPFGLSCNADSGIIPTAYLHGGGKKNSMRLDVPCLPRSKIEQKLSV